MATRTVVLKRSTKPNSRLEGEGTTRCGCEKWVYLLKWAWLGQKNFQARFARPPKLIFLDETLMGFIGWREGYVGIREGCVGWREG